MELACDRVSRSVLGLVSFGHMHALTPKIACDCMNVRLEYEI